MNKRQLIEKWEGQLAMWRRVCEDPLMYTKEDRLKASHHCQVIASFLGDAKDLEEVEPELICPNCKQIDPHLLFNGQYQCDNCSEVWSLKPTIPNDDGWFSMEDKSNPVPNTGNIEIKFKNGHICDYNQENWPFDIVTHWRFKLKTT